MTNLQKVFIPDIGGATDVDVIELLVKPGDVIAKETPLITLESEKATMDIPSPVAGTVSSMSIKTGDKVSEGDLILMVQPDLAAAKSQSKTEPSAESSVIVAAPTVVQPELPKTLASIEAEPKPAESMELDESTIAAGPAARRLARVLEIDLQRVHGSGRKSRITRDDVEQYVKQQLSKPAHGGVAFPQPRVIDFSKFGKIESKPLNKIKRLTGIGVHQAWVTIPHVTQFDDADITELETFRKAEVAQSKDNTYKLTILSFVCKAVCKALEVYPQFNSSLDPSGENLIYKQYYNIGIAVETPNGLVVPVIKAVNALSIHQIAAEMARLSHKARDKGLAPADMAGGCFTISSLGGIGGTAFTPIVNSPEVAILGLSKTSIKPVYQGGTFVPRLILPLSLSYDHRVIDGAEAARFTRYLSEILSDIRKILL